MYTAIIAVLVTSSCATQEDGDAEKAQSASSTVIWEFASGADWVEYRGRQYVPDEETREQSWQDDWSGPLVLSGSAVAGLPWISTCANVDTTQVSRALIPTYVAMIPWYRSMLANDLSGQRKPIQAMLDFTIFYVQKTQADETIEGRDEFFDHLFSRIWQPVECRRRLAVDNSSYIESVTHFFDGSNHRLVGELHLGEIAGTGTVTWHGGLMPYHQWEVGRLAALSCAWLNSNAVRMAPQAALNTDSSQRVANEARRSQMALVNYLIAVDTPLETNFLVDIGTGWQGATTTTDSRGRAEGTFLTVLDALRLNGGWSCDAREGKEPYFFTVLE